MFRQTALAAAFTLIMTPVIAKDGLIGLTPTEDDTGAMAAKRSYSPYAGRAFPTRVYWGDTHVHTDNSLDARGWELDIPWGDVHRVIRGDVDEAVSGCSGPNTFSLMARARS